MLLQGMAQKNTPPLSSALHIQYQTFTFSKPENTGMNRKSGTHGKTNTFHF
jgi:hypothetical protein